MTSKTQNQDNGNNPRWRLVQQKAFYKIDASGRPIRSTKNIELAVGWDDIGRDSGKPYISWSDSVTPVLPDIDGRIILRAFEISYEEEKK
ncbi:hypothetical protein QQ020_26000 [Fulvivirgaceae bacterium BMA12]|uniref:Uncharacterized protein n=1 Tax=Agaribacillus aureus TaxID=3051825 RepID=A0ABT8LCS8_9BACT|nr:hypothetical protein [Fulvivirgaceae bacterium BMA12]